MKRLLIATLLAAAIAASASTRMKPGFTNGYFCEKARNICCVGFTIQSVDKLLFNRALPNFWHDFTDHVLYVSVPFALCVCVECVDTLGR